MDSNTQAADVLLASKYQSSPHKDRSLDNVVFQDTGSLQKALIGPIKPQNDKDYDMTHQMVIDNLDGKFKEADLVSQLTGNFEQCFGKAKSEYSMLDSIFNSQEVEKNIDYDQTMHGGRDRYTDIITYFKSQVKLLNGVGKQNHDQYINCCFVNNIFSFDQPAAEEKYGNKKIIASQGPLPKTTDHFWQMLVEQNVTMVVSTCRTVEQGRSKCNQFWPSKVNETDQFKITQSSDDNMSVQVSLLSQEELTANKMVLKRELQVTKPDGTVQNVTQIHFIGWPDHGVPQGEAVSDFEVMLNYFVEWNLKSADDEKAVVHCSAGIGRTGTTISLMNTMIAISAQKNAGVADPHFSLFHAVRQLREHREGSVQTFVQYQFMYQFLNYWVKKNFNL